LARPFAPTGFETPDRLLGPGWTPGSELRLIEPVHLAKPRLRQAGRPLRQGPQHQQHPVADNDRRFTPPRALDRGPAARPRREEKSPPTTGRGVTLTRSSRRGLGVSQSVRR